MIDLDTMSRKDLMQLRTDVDRAISSVSDREARRALEAAENVAREHGYSLSDLMKLTAAKSGRGGRGAGSKSSGRGMSGSEAKYRHPEDHSKTWSGRGRRPRWVHDHEANGGQLADLAI